MNNIACRIFAEQIKMLLALPNQEEAKTVLYCAVINSLNQFENQIDNQNENQFENAYVSVSDSVSISVLSKSILDLLSKNIVWKEFSNNYGGKRINSGRKSKINQDENQVDNQLENQEDCNLANKHKHNNNNNLNNKYKINYSVIKLTEKDFNNWQEAYPYLNIRAECMVRNEWLEKQPEEIKKKWFITTAKYFVQQNELRKKQQKEENTLDDNWGRKATYEDFDKFMKDF